MRSFKKSFYGFANNFSNLLNLKFFSFYFLYLLYLLHLLNLFNYLLSLFCFSFIMLHNQSVTNSEFLSVSEVHDNTASRATSSWGLWIIFGGTALATVNKECTSATHFTWFLRLQIEWAWSLGCLMHHINAITKFVGGGWEGACIDNTLVIRIEIAFTLSAIGHCIHCPFS